MSFTLAKPGGFALGDKLTSTEITAIDNNAYHALDKRAAQTDDLESTVSCVDAGRIIDSVELVTSVSTIFSNVEDGIRVVDCALTSVGRTFTLENANAILGDRVRVRNTSETYTLTVEDDGSSTLAILGGAGASAYQADFYFDGSEWTLWDKQGLTAPEYGGTGLDNSAASGIVKYTAGTPSVIVAGAGDMVGTTGTQTLTNKSLTAPTITGAVTITGFTSTTTTSSDSKTVTIDALGSVETTDATVTSAYTSGTLTDNAVHSIDVIVTAIKSDYTAAAVYKRCYSGRRAGGTWTQLAAVSDDKTDETTSTWNVTVDVSGGTFRVRVTGVAANTIRWGYAVRMQSTVP